LLGLIAVASSLSSVLAAFFKSNIGFTGTITYKLHDESIKKGTSYGGSSGGYKC